MKKIILSVTALLLLLVTLPVSALEKPKVTDHEKVVINMFRGNGCSACKNALTDLVGLNGEYDDYIEIKTYEVWHDSSNSAFLQELIDDFKEEKPGVPFFVIGDKHFVGYSQEEIIGYALELYQDKKYSDYVSKKAKKSENKLTSMTLKEAAIEDGIIEDTTKATETKTNKNDILIVVGIFVVLIGGMAGLIVASKK